jgi:hypothetical protein
MPNRDEFCPTEFFCNNDEQARTIACEYYKPKLLHHPVWTVNGTNSRDCITVTTLNATHHIAVLNYSNFQPGAYQVKLEFSRLVGHLKTFCQDLVPLYKTTIIVTGTSCEKTTALPGRIMSTQSTLQVTKLFRNLLAKLRIEQHLEFEILERRVPEE